MCPRQIPVQVVRRDASITCHSPLVYNCSDRRHNILVLDNYGGGNDSRLCLVVICVMSMLSVRMILKRLPYLLQMLAFLLLIADGLIKVIGLKLFIADQIEFNLFCLDRLH